MRSLPHLLGVGASDLSVPAPQHELPGPTCFLLYLAVAASQSWLISHPGLSRSLLSVHLSKEINPHASLGPAQLNVYPCVFVIITVPIVVTKIPDKSTLEMDR